MKLNAFVHITPETDTRRQPQAGDGLECAPSLVGDAGIIILSAPDA